MPERKPMITRTARSADLAPLAEILRKHNRRHEFTSIRELRKYHRGRNRRIVVTYREDGQVYALVFYRFLLRTQRVFCDLIALDCEDLSCTQELAQSLQAFFTYLLLETPCEWVIAEVHEPTIVFQNQMAAIGFLRESECPGCQGGSYVFALHPEHWGGVIVERILAGNARVLTNA